MGTPAVDFTTTSRPLRELVEEAAREGEVILTEAGEAVAKIIPLPRARKPRRPGSARGKIHMADDFDETPDELKEFF